MLLSGSNFITLGRVAPTHGVTSTTTSLSSQSDISVSLRLNVFPPAPKPPSPIAVNATCTIWPLRVRTQRGAPCVGWNV